MVAETARAHLVMKSLCGSNKPDSEIWRLLTSISLSEKRTSSNFPFSLTEANCIVLCIGKQLWQQKDWVMKTLAR